MKHLIIAIATWMISAAPSVAYDLDQHRWQHRVLILIAPDHRDPAIESQREWLHEHSDAVVDRDLRVFELFTNNGWAEDAALTPTAVDQLRKRLRLTPDDRLIILIGKDGGIKQRAALESDLHQILRQIDAMPMRRDEIREKEAAGIEVTPP